MAIRKAKTGQRLQEQKEQFLGKIEAGPAQKKSGGPPLYLMLMLLALGILIGIVLFMSFAPKPPVVPVGSGDGPDANFTQPDLAYKTVPITMVYSPQCKRCRQTNTIEELFKVRKIPYEISRVEADSNEGKALVEKYGIEKVPTAIIPAATLDFFPTTKADFAKAFQDQNGNYAIGEENLDDRAYYPSYFLSKVPQMCSGTNPAVTIFDDFYSTLNTKNRRALYSFAQDFNSEADIRFSYTQTADSQDQNAVLGNLFLMCASEQGKYLELERAMAGIYCNNPFKGDETILTDVEIDGCASISSHYGMPLGQFELDVAAKRAGLDINKFTQCYDNRKFYYTNAEQSVKDLGIRRAGTVLMDCRETTFITHVRDSFCAMHPRTSECSRPIDANAGK